MNEASWQFENRETVESWAYASAMFSDQECDDIIQIGEQLTSETALTYDSESFIEMNHYRNSSVSFVLPSDDTRWLFEKLETAIVQANERFFNFNVTGFAEPLTFTKYVAPQGKYNYHIDKIYGQSIRKLSCVIQLSDPSNYDGGELQILTSDTPTSAPKERGTIIFFPAYVLHRVTELTQGTRYSLVGWTTGPPFR